MWKIFSVLRVRLQLLKLPKVDCLGAPILLIAIYRRDLTDLASKVKKAQDPKSLFKYCQNG